MTSSSPYDPGVMMQNDELEHKIESHTQALRDLLRIIPSDGPPTLGVDGVTMRAQAKEVFTAIAGFFKIVQKAAEETGEIIERLEGEINDLKPAEDRLQDLIEKVLDVQRRIITGRELIDYVKETYGA